MIGCTGGVGADSPWRSVADVVAAAKARPGLTYAVSGTGSPGRYLPVKNPRASAK